MYPQLWIRETSSCKKRRPSVAHIVRRKKKGRNIEIDEFESVHGLKGIRARARARNRWKSRADVVWCEFNSAYKRKLSRTWNSLTRRTKSRRENLPSSREIYEPRSIYRSTGSRTRAIIDVLNLPTWPVWSRACYRKAIWNLSQALDFRCTPPKKSTTRVYFF